MSKTEGNKANTKPLSSSTLLKDIFSSEEHKRHHIAIEVFKQVPSTFTHPGTSLTVQWLGLCNSTAGGMGSIPGWGTKILSDAAKRKKNK